jgi:hypothetical protein
MTSAGQPRWFPNECLPGYTRNQTAIELTTAGNV